MASLLRGRRSAIASATVLSVAAGSLVAMAFTSNGQASTTVKLHDAGVWVTGTTGGVLGLFNTEIKQSVIALVPHSEKFDVLQDGSTVLLHDDGGRRLRMVDIAGAALTGAGAQIPAGAQVGMNGGVIAVAAPNGDVWIRGVSDAAAADYSERPDLQLGAGAAIAVGADGTVHAASLVRSRLVSIPRGSPAAAARESMRLPEGAKAVSVSAVGPAPVALVDGAMVQLAGADPVPLPNAGPDTRLQQVGDSADSVLVATSSSLLGVSLDDRKVKTISADAGSGSPSAPVRLGRCSYAAWGARPTLLTACDGTPAKTSPVGSGASAALVFRVNRGRIVLNDVANGNTYLLDDPRQQLADWKSARLRDDDADQDPNKTDSSDNSDIKPEDRNRPNRPPAAADDTFGVRAGATVVMPVLANDGDPDGDVLTVAEIEADVDPAIGVVQIIQNGKALQFITAADASGTATFAYVASDGRTGTAKATVTVSVVPATTNSVPRPLSASATSSTSVVRGGRVVHNILKDWIDPDGDQLVLVCPPAVVGATCSADGQVAYQDSRRQTGGKQLSFQVSDGRETSSSLLAISVIAPGSQPPLARSDFVHAFVGREVVATPLDNDTSFAKEPVRLAKIEGADPAAGVTADPADGTLRIAPTAAGTSYLTYQIVTGALSAFGIMRIDATVPGEGEPVAAPDSALVRPDQPALVDVLANDFDPAGNVLVVTDTRSTSAGLTIEVLGHQLIRLSADATFVGPATVNYSIHAGSKSATSFIVVRRSADQAPNQPPVTKDDRAVARVGQPVYLDVLANDVDPEAGQLEIEPALVGADAAFRPAGSASTEASQRVEAFVAGDEVRLLAPVEPGLVSLSYSAVDPAGQTATASITVQVIAYDAPNRAPTPRAVQARVLAGRAVTLDIPLSGIDPDGDPVKLEPVDAPAKGTLAATKDNRLVYTAGPEAGTYEFRYQVTDSGGLAGAATVLVGVAPPSTTPRPPVAVNDAAQVRNDRNRIISIPVLANDSDPDGDALELTDKLVTPAGVTAKVAGEYVAVSVAKGSTEQLTMSYSIESAGGTDDALVSVTSSATAPLIPPTALDDFPTGEATGGTIDVPVLTNDTNATGPATELSVSAEPGAVGPTGVATRLNERTVRVTRTDRDQWATYTIMDADGGEAKAFIFVPRNDNQAPRAVDPLPAFEVKAGTSRALSISDFAVDPEGKPVELTTAQSISASGVTVSAVTRRGFMVAPTIPSGKAAVTFEVMDGSDPAAANVRTAKIAIVVDVLPVDEVPPVFATKRVPVEFGEATPVTVNLDDSTTAGPQDAGRFTYGGLTGRVAGLTAGLSSGRGNILSVSAPTAPVGTRVSLGFTVTIGRQIATGRVEVEVVQTTRPPPLASDCSAGAATANSTVSVDLAKCTVNPFPDSPLTVSPTTWQSPAGAATARGLRVSVSVPAGFSGSARIPYTVKDKLGRTASANIVFAVVGRPGPPGTPTIITPLPGGGTVLLTWAPADANGGIIDYYTVRDSLNGYSFRCAGAGTRCLVSGVDYSKAYSFTVTAHTLQHGDGQPSAPVTLSSESLPPDTPHELEAVAGDERATLSWTGTFRATPTASYTVTVRPAPDGGSGVFTIAAPSNTSPHRASYSLGGLRNGVGYTFSVVATGRGGDNSAEVTSEVFTPAGVARAPAAPTVASSGGLRGGEVTVSWDPADVLQAANGRLATLRIIQGGTESSVRDATSVVNTGRMVIDGLDASGSYSFALQVTNNAGSSATSAAATATVEGKPGAPSWATILVGDREARLQFTLAAANGTAYTSITVSVTNRTTSARRAMAVTPVAGQVAYAVVASSLVNGQTYEFSVIACNVSQCSDEVPAQGTVVPFGSPTAPAPTVLVERRSVTFSWGSPDFNGSEGVLLISVAGADYPANACPPQTIGAGQCTFTGSWNTSYTMTVTAQTSGGSDPKSVTGQVEPAATPVAPQVTAEASFRSVTFTWGEPNFGGLDGVLKLSVLGPDFTGDCPATASGAGSCRITGAWDTDYTLRVSAESEGGADVASATVHIVPAPRPAAPQPQSSVNGRQVSFSWGAPDYNGLPGTMSLSISGPGDTSSCSQPTGGAGSCSFKAEYHGVYQLTIRVDTDGGIDEKSATATVGPPPAPSAPQPSGSTNGLTVNFTWGEPDFNELPGTLSLSVSGPGDTSNCTRTQTTESSGSCSFQGEYDGAYVMTATVSTAGGSVSKESSQVVVGSRPKPIAPPVTASANGRQVTLSWGAPDYKGLPGTMDIDVTGAGSSGKCPSSPAGADSCTFVGNYLTQYTVTVTVTTAGGTDSNTVSVTTDPAPPPGAPTVSGSLNGRDVTFVWDDPQFNGPSGSMTIVVEGPGDHGDCPSSATQGGTCSFTGDYSATYKMTVTVVTIGGTDSNSDSVTVGDAPPPPAPGQPTVTANLSDRNKVTFSWSAPDFNGVPGGTMTLAVDGPGPHGDCPSSATDNGSCTFDGAYDTAYTMTAEVQTAGGTKTDSDSVTTESPPILPSPTSTPTPTPDPIP